MKRLDAVVTLLILVFAVLQAGVASGTPTHSRIVVSGDPTEPGDGLGDPNEPDPGFVVGVVHGSLSGDPTEPSEGTGDPDEPDPDLMSIRNLLRFGVMQIWIRRVHKF